MRALVRAHTPCVERGRISDGCIFGALSALLTALYIGAGMAFQLFKFLKRSNLGYMVLKIEYVIKLG